MIRLHLLGSLAVVQEDGTSLRSLLVQPKRFGLLAYLAVLPSPSAHRRDTLLGLFWPELDEERARQALRQSLYGLRRSLGPGVVIGQGDELVRVDEKRLWCDATAFDVALKEGRDEEALALYRGEFLAGFHLSGTPAFEHWVEAEGRRLRQAAVRAAWRLAGSARDRSAVRKWAERALELAPYDEEGLRRYVKLMGEHGQAAAAVRAYEAFAARLSTDLGLEPSPETIDLAARARSGAIPPGAPPAPPVGVTAPAIDSADGVEESPTELGPPRATAARTLPAAPRRSWRGVAAVASAIALVAAAALGLGHALRDGPSVLEAVEEPPPASIAVLAFDDLSPDGDQTWFADGIAEEILHSLTRVEGLRVSGRNSSFAFRGRPMDVRRIGMDLGVDLVLEGSVRKGGDSVWITAQLIDAATGFHRWSEAYAKAPSAESLRAMQVEVAREVAAALALEFRDPGEPEQAVPPDQAYEGYLAGRSLLRRVQTEFGEEEVLRRADLLRSVGSFRQVVHLAPDWAPGWAALGEALHWAASGGIEPEAYYAESKASLERATDLDPGHAGAHASLGFVLQRWNGDFAGAEARYRHALALGGGEAWGGYAGLLEATGRYAEAVDAYRHAEAHDPLSVFVKMGLARALLCAERFDEAIAYAERGFGLGRGDWPLWTLALALERSGRVDEALERIDRMTRDDPEGGHWDGARALLHARAGRFAEARALLDGLDPDVLAEPRAYPARAAALAALGETEAATRLLETWVGAVSPTQRLDCRYPEIHALSPPASSS